VVRERFLREARASARLSHPSIVPIYAADERGGVTFLVMAYVDGTTLSPYARRESRTRATAFHAYAKRPGTRIVPVAEPSTLST
jgi:serine/threonine protein kinase